MPHPDTRPTSPTPKHLTGEPAFPERIEQMIALIRKHRALLCTYTTLAFELHVRNESVKAKISFNPEE